ncbi:centrosomal protein CEP57L1 [Rhinophrynus dorsalis]
MAPPNLKNGCASYLGETADRKLNDASRNYPRIFKSGRDQRTKGKPQRMECVSKESFIQSFYQLPGGEFLSDSEYKSSSTKKTSSSSLNPRSNDILQAPNSKALISALKTLQEKICRLELEKSQAHDRLTSLSRVAAEHKVLDCERERKESAQHESLRQDNDVTAQLNAAQQRCLLLEKQLDYMRKMVENAEMQRNTVLEQQALLQQANMHDNTEVHSKLKKLDLLEKECLRLVTTQRTAEKKISQLEEKLSAEEQQRKLMQDKAAQLQTGIEVNRILLSSASTQHAPQKIGKKKKQLKKVIREPLHQKFYPKATELPFVAGKSTSSSHSLSANVQTVLHMMKYQSPQGTQQPPRSTQHKPTRHLSASSHIPTCSVPVSKGDTLTDILLALQDELGQMSFEHQELLKQINETKNNEVREDLERELDYLVKQMETKSDQILKLKRHQLNVIKLKKTAQSMKKHPPGIRPVPCERNVSAAVQASPKRNQENLLAKSTPTPKSKASLELLKNVQKIQTSLKKDDIMWEK